MSREDVSVLRIAAAEMRRLLRALEDPVAMSRNRLVAPLFESSSDRATFTRVRAAILAAVEELAPAGAMHADAVMHRTRQHEIIKRYDLGDASMAALLEQLCIERSQFYRERACALEWLGQRLQRYVREVSEDRPDVLRRLAGSDEDPLERARCLLRIAEINVSSDCNEARAHAEEAVRILQSAG